MWQAAFVFEGTKKSVPWKQVLLFDTAVAAGISQLSEMFVLQGEAGALLGWYGSGGHG